jgi:hypothetical protein
MPFLPSPLPAIDPTIFAALAAGAMLIIDSPEV